MRWNMSALCNLGLLASRERKQHGCTWLLMFNSFYTFFDKKKCLKYPENIVIFVAKKVVQGIKWNASHVMQIKDDYTKSRTFLFLWLARSGSQSKHKFRGFSHIYIYISLIKEKNTKKGYRNTGFWMVTIRYDSSFTFWHFGKRFCNEKPSII